MKVQTKFRCISKTHLEGSIPKPAADGSTAWGVGMLCSVRLSAVNGDTPTNKSWWYSSPSGGVEIGCANLAAADQFEVGKTYLTTFELDE